MSRSLNKVMLIGNVGEDPEVRTTSNGTRVVNLSLATNSTYTDRSGQQQQKTQWHRLVIWAKLAEVVEQYVRKGDRLYVEGEVEYTQSEDSKGNVRYFTDVKVREMVMLGSPSGGGDQREQRDGGDQHSGRQQQRAQPSKRAVRKPAPAGSKPAQNPFLDDGEDDIPL